MMLIRPAKYSDLSNIAQLHAQSWRDNYHQVLEPEYLNNQVHADRAAVWQKRLQQPQENQLVLVAEVNQVFAGFICVFGDNHQIYGSIIDNLHVKFDNKGQRIGSRLMAAAAKWLMQHHPENSLYLEVLACNPKAIGFYESQGALYAATAYWQTPCHNQAKEYVYLWHSPKMLLNNKQVET
jgi:ribosomal protein S18 acetylase RimI-like enzyme